MAVFPPEVRATLAVGLLLLPVAQAAGPAVAARPPSGGEAHSGQEIILDADTWSIDNKANRMSFAAVTITQGELSIKADDAVANGTGLKFDDSHWQFNGNVRVHGEGLDLTADQVIVHFSGNRIAQASATGAPAQFEQKLPNQPRIVHGHAVTIDYDLLTQVIHLTQDAWINDGRNEMSSAALLYNIREQQAQNEVGPGESSGGRVHITIRPDTATDGPPGARP